MKHKLFFLILIVKIVLANTVFAGYTLLDKNRLIFSDGGGFDVITTVNIDTGKEEMVIRALPYNNSQDSYRAKGIEFKGPSDSAEDKTSIVYEIKSQVYTDPNECGSSSNLCPREYFMVHKDAGDKNIDDGQNLGVDGADTSLDAIIDADNTYWSVDLQVTTLDSEIDDDDKFNLIIGESSAGFITLGNDGSAHNITGYKMTGSGSGYTLSYDPIRLALSGKPVYIGKIADDYDSLPFQYIIPDPSIRNVPMITLTSAYHVDNKARFSLNTNRVIEKLTIGGNFNVGKNLVTNSDFGVLEQEIHTNHSVVDQNAAPYELVCKDFTVNYVNHNFLFIGSISGAREGNEAAIQSDIWFTLYYYNASGTPIPYINTATNSTPTKVKEASRRTMEGSWDQSHYSMVTQHVENELPYNLETLTNQPEDIHNQTQVTYKLCIVHDPSGSSTRSFKTAGDQNQIMLVGLPAANLDAVIPEIPPDQDSEVFVEAEIEIDVADRALLEQNGVIMESEMGDIAGIATSGDFMIFTDGKEPAHLQAHKFAVDQFKKLSVYKVLNIGTEAPFNIQIPNNKLSFVLPQDDDEDQAQLYTGPYGQVLIGDTLSVDTSKELARYGITTTGALKLKSGLSIGPNSSIEMSTEQPLIGDENKIAKLVLDGESSPGFQFYGPDTNVAFTGGYGGSVATMFYLRCGGTTGTNQSTISSSSLVKNASCNTSTTPISFDLDYDTLQVAGSADIGAKFIILSSLSSYTTDRNSGVRIVVDIPHAHPSTRINNKECTAAGSGLTCQTDNAVFAGDSGANSYYSFGNVARLEKVKTSELSSSAQIKVKLVTQDLGLQNFRDDGPGASSTNFGITSGEADSSGAILVIHFMDKL